MRPATERQTSRVSSRDAFLAVSFALGCGVSLVAHALSKGAGTLFGTLPFWWGWMAVSRLWGPEFATGHQWLGAVVGAPVHGAVMAGVSWGVDALIRAVSEPPRLSRATTLAGVTLAYLWLLTAFPVTP